MTDHDPLCPSGPPGSLANRITCECDLIARVVDREAERHHPTRRTAHGFAVCQRCHAESVAARLVEVICELSAERASADRWAHVFEAQRDAARAEVAALRRLVPIVYGMGRDDEASALPMREFDMRDPREVLADLRAKVDECSTVGEVLTLIEEVDRD